MQRFTLRNNSTCPSVGVGGNVIFLKKKERIVFASILDAICANCNGKYCVFLTKLCFRFVFSFEQNKGAFFNT